MPPEDFNTRAEKIAADLDKNNLILASNALYEEARNLSPADFKKLTESVMSKDKKGVGIDISLDERSTNEDGAIKPGSVVALISSENGNIFRREQAIITDEKVASIWVPSSQRRDDFLADEKKDIVKLLEHSDLEGASQRINALFRLNDSLGYGTLRNTLVDIEASDTKRSGVDLKLLKLAPSDPNTALKVVLTHRSGPDHTSREIGTIEPLSAKETWKPSEGARQANDLSNPYFNKYLKSPLYSERNK